MLTVTSRHQFLDPLKPELTSEDAKKAETTEGNLNTEQNSSKQQMDDNPSDSNYETSAVPLNGCSNFESSKLSYEPVSLNTMNTLKMAGPSASSAPFINNVSASLRIEGEIEGIDALHHGKEATGCDWDSLISDASELLNFNSPSEMVPYKGSGQSTLDCTDYKVDGTDNNPSEKNDGMNGAPENHQTVDSTLNNFEVGEQVEDADEV